MEAPDAGARDLTLKRTGRPDRLPARQPLRAHPRRLAARRRQPPALQHRTPLAQPRLPGRTWRGVPRRGARIWNTHRHRMAPATAEVGRPGPHRPSASRCTPARSPKSSRTAAG
ncbi:hypothetical protein ACRAWF_43660 [Streptomyces sp. L7]